MFMWHNWSLKAKLLALAGFCTLSLAGLLAGVLFSTHRAANAAARECGDLSSRELDGQVRGLLSLCELTQEAQQQMVDVTLKTAEKLLLTAGGLKTSKTETVPWTAVDQFSGRTTALTLPKPSLGALPLVQNRDPGVSTPVVDEVSRLTGQTCTLFQRMNSRSKRCNRVNTRRSRSLDKVRAIGMIITRMEQDDTSNADP